MNKKVRWITRTAILLALLVVLQALTKPLGQLVTGSCVNAVLAVAVLVSGVWSGVTVALISPVLAYLLGIAPMPLTVPVIMAGNAVYVLVLWWIAGRHSALFRKIAGWLCASVAKFAVLYLLVAKLICGLLASGLQESGVLKPAMLTALPVTFGWPQLITALIGGAVALAVTPVIRKALDR